VLLRTVAKPGRVLSLPRRLVGRQSESEYHQLTYDLTLAAAKGHSKQIWYSIDVNQLAAADADKKIL
jgi:hypothetical protein